MRTSVVIIFLIIAFVGCNKDVIDQSPIGTRTPAPFPQPSNFPPAFLPADNPQTKEGIALGRRLFFEKRLSGDNTMSCATCHVQENNFGEITRFSTGIDGSIGDRNAMTLHNLAWGSAFFWNGRQSTLEKQALDPVENPIEMKSNWPDVIAKLEVDPFYQKMFTAAFGANSITKENAAKAIAQFERTLISANSKFDQWQKGTYTFTSEELAGYNIFNTEVGDCFHCHGDLTTGNLFGAYGALQFANNGVDSVLTPNTGYEFVTGDPADRGKFKISSLRNIEYSFPYMHDGRFQTLQEVIEFYSTGVNKTYTLDPNMEKEGRIKKNFTQPQKDALLAFLLTLTDLEFLSDTTFSDPW